jgi:hypothetical protein
MAKKREGGGVNWIRQMRRVGVCISIKHTLRPSLKVGQQEAGDLCGWALLIVRARRATGKRADETKPQNRGLIYPP